MKMDVEGQTDSAMNALLNRERKTGELELTDRRMNNTMVEERRGTRSDGHGHGRDGA
jgi:hypothetical protein